MIYLHTPFERDHIYPLSTIRLPYNSLFVCPFEARVWAKVVRNPSAFYDIYPVPAEGHPPSIEAPVAGSLLWWEWRVGGIEALELPPPLLWREVELVERLTRCRAPGYNVAHNDYHPFTTMTPTLMQQIAALRAKQAAGTLTDAELREFIANLRAGRMAAATSAAVKRAAARIDPDAALESFLS